ncbi:hypothetical protein Q5424_06235 [Conexibacter sp. JD483]|uniref:hypothetical protein n=1 Tax=unclassified Conexibacter TaxID=2627773 RepID=UPI002723D769|nr:MULTISPECIES: hypothetical protein [unclassified Conexibacter]MDO8184845.1 hypothetical protein [Conexibacter sp. CPCC 205706]MDO8196620.1 hypothetical protein [Conexibacter sp. CPCC 205762]MDR9368667.1 hypothetical protein [Conexibacter sp. JD483]
MSERPTPPAGGAGWLSARLATLRHSDFAKAGGLAIAMIANNVVALAATVVFARQLDDYGALAALLAYVLILSVIGQALQVATAREAVLGTLGRGPDLAATLRSWTRTLLVVTVVLGVVSALLREPIAAAVGVDEQWAAACGLPAGVLWLLLAILRGALQGIGDYRAVGVSLVGEQGARLVFGVLLAAVGLDVTGAFLGTPVAMGVIALWCGTALRDHLLPPGAEHPPPAPALRLRDHIAGAWVPIGGLVIVAVLQNIDVIAAQHRLDQDLASSYGATTVAAKMLIWVAIGIGFYLVPETSRRFSAGEPTRPVLLRSLSLLLLCAVPALAIFALVPRLLLRLAFGADRLLAVDALLPLGVAFTLLALTYLAIQYLLALRAVWFLLPLSAVAALEPILLLAAAPADPRDFALLVLAIQALACAVALALAFTRPRAGARQQPAARRPARPPRAAAGSTPRG